MRARLALTALALLAAAPAVAQRHAMPGMAMPMPAPTATPKPKAKGAKPAATPAVKPRTTKKKPARKPAPSAPPSPLAAHQPGSRHDTAADPMPAMDHSQMDHSQINPSQMNHGEMDGMDLHPMDHGVMDMAPIPQGPAPAAAGSGPPRAADAIWGEDAMRASRRALRAENGARSYFWLLGDRVEYRARQGRDGYLWDVQGYYGGDIDKLWVKSEGEGAFGEKPESAEVQGLWSHAIGPWWDLQAGVRQDLAGPERTHAVIGVQGLAPYEFGVDAAAFLSTEGDITARVEAELDQRVTQRLILQPRAELNLSAQDVPELGIGAGLDTVELGVRLRYELAREFAPYVGIEQEWKTGRSADYARLEGEDASVTNVVLGLRFWF